MKKSDSIHSAIKTLIGEHKDEIEMIQVAINSAVGGFIYSEFLRTFKQKLHPVRRIFVAEISSISKLLSPGSELLELMSKDLIDDICTSLRPYITEDVPELQFLLDETNVDILKAVFELVIAPNMAMSIPTVISHKFGLDDEENQLFCQSGDVDLFPNIKFADTWYVSYIITQAVINILFLVPSINKEITPIENNQDIKLIADDPYVLTVGNDNAITEIHFNRAVLHNEDVMPMLEFVTSSTFSYVESDIGEEGDYYQVKTSPFNRVVLTKLPYPKSSDDEKSVDAILNLVSNLEN